MEFKRLYDLMFQAQQAGDTALADRYRRELEDVRKLSKREISIFDLPDALRDQLPPFVFSVLGKSQRMLGRSEKSNCINASLNFHATEPRFEPYATLEFLDILQSQFRQIEEGEGVETSDLVVGWSRFGGSWDSRRINVHQMSRSDADFPYGLIFDHVVVRLDPHFVFHKPDGTLESLYQLDDIDTAFLATRANTGFELTYHRAKCSGFEGTSATE